MSGADKDPEAVQASLTRLQKRAGQVCLKARELEERPADGQDVCRQVHRSEPSRPGERQPASARRSSGIPVLIVIEDDPDDFMLLKRALNKAGASARVWWARDVHDALRILADVELSASGVCVVLDVHLPGGDGFQVLEQLKMRTSQCPVRFAFLTGMTDRGTADRAAAVGADGFFVKPGGSEELIQVARSLQKLAATP